MVNAGKILADICLENKHFAVLSQALTQHFLRLVGARVCAFPYAAGIAARNESRFPYWLYGSKDGVLDDAIAEQYERRNLAAPWLCHMKDDVTAALIFVPYQFVLQLYQISLKVTLKMPAGPAGD